MNTKFTCPYCQSTAIYQLCKNTDGGVNLEYVAANDDSCYAEMPETLSRSDMDIFRCGNCGHFFGSDTPASTPPVSYVTVERLQERLENVREAQRFETTEYKQMCITLQGKVAKASYKDMATCIPPMFEEVQKKFIEMSKLDAQIDVLEYIIAKDAITPSPTSDAQGGSSV